MIIRSKSTVGLVGILSLALVACSDGGSNAVDAMKKADEDPVVETKKDGEKKEIPTADLPEPTAEELAAWDRKDPEGEKHLYKWDKANAKKMQTYWKELRCLRDKMKVEGQLAFGTEPGGEEQMKWEQFKLAFISMVVDPWQMRLFAAEGQDILTKSKVIGHILEAHEMIMRHYPTAYNDGDEVEIKVQDARWTVVENKVKDYYEKIGAPLELPDLEDPKDLKKWEKFCAPILLPPKGQAKAK
jgi:hypothetical protein